MKLLRHAPCLSCLVLHLVTSPSMLQGESLYCIHFLDSFRNKSGKPQPIWAKVGTHAQVIGNCIWPTTFTKFWARSVTWGRNGAFKSVPDAGFFVSNIRDNFSATSQRPIFAKFGHDTRIVVETHFWKKFRKSFHSGVKLVGSNRHLTQSRLQVKDCTAKRYCLL